MELGSTKKIEIRKFLFQKILKKNHSGGEYYDPSMRKFPTTKSLYFDLCKKEKSGQISNF